MEKDGQRIRRLYRNRHVVRPQNEQLEPSTLDSQGNNYMVTAERRGLNPQATNFLVQQQNHGPYMLPQPCLTPIQQHVSSGDYLYNINNLPPSSPPGFFLPPQQEDLYCSSQFVSPTMAMYPIPQQGPNQGLHSLHDTSLDLKRSQDQQLQDYGINLNMLLDAAITPGRHKNEHVFHNMQQHDDGINNSRSSSPKKTMNSGGFKNLPIIDPMIENIVGSMSTSTGTYTHFGPSVTGIIGQTNVSSGSDCTVGRISPPSSITSQTSFIQHHQQQNEIKSLQSSLHKEMDLSEKIDSSSHSRIFGKESLEKEVEMLPQRAATPKKDGTDSRPQTPKLSYSEVLTKNQPNQGTSQKSAVPSSNSPSMMLASAYRIFDNGQVFSSTANTTSVGLSNRRTSNLQGDITTTASNSSSSSSSPVMKHKVPSSSSGSANGLLKNRKGKENSSNPSSKSSTTKSTPTHSNSGSVQNDQQFQKSGKGERKILSSSSLNATLTGNSPSSTGNSLKNQQTNGTRSSTSTSPVGVGKNNTKTFQFEFDIEDLDDKISESVNKSKRGGGVSCTTSSAKTNNNKVYTNGMSPFNGNVTSGVEKKTGSLISNGNAGQVLSSSLRRSRLDKNEKTRSRKGDRNCTIRRVRLLTTLWISSVWINLISALNWLWSLVVNVGTLSCSLAFSLLEDFYSWWTSNAIPSVRRKIVESQQGVWSKICSLWRRVRLKIPWWKDKGAEPESTNNFCGPKGKNDEIFSMMGPERNIVLPSTGEEALKRLLSVKGQDPYSILGVPSNSSDETVRRYYKKQAVLVHPDKNVVPGAEEAFKILARAFELVGEPAKRMEYHRQLLRAQEKDRVFGEIGNLLEQLRKKMESVSNTIRCTKCSSRHKKVRTNRPLFAARYCAQCRINHAAREGDLWAERGKGFLGLFWHMNYYTCMENAVWEINEWAACQKKNLAHLLHDSHNIMYRLVAGGNGGKNSSKASSKGGGSTGESQQPSGFDEHGTSAQEDVNPEFDDDWNTLINNLCRSSTSGSSSATPNANNSKNSNSTNTSNIGSKTSGVGAGASKFGGNDLRTGDSGVNLPHFSTSNSSSTCAGFSSTARRRGKVKRK